MWRRVYAFHILPVFDWGLSWLSAWRAALLICALEASPPKSAWRVSMKLAG